MNSVRVCSRLGLPRSPARRQRAIADAAAARRDSGGRGRRSRPYPAACQGGRCLSRFRGARLDGLPPELLQEAMRAGVMAEGAAFENKVVAAIQSSNGRIFHPERDLCAWRAPRIRPRLSKLLALSLTPQIRTGDCATCSDISRRSLRRDRRCGRGSRRILPRLRSGCRATAWAARRIFSRFGCNAEDKAELRVFFASKGCAAGRHATGAEGKRGADRSLHRLQGSKRRGDQSGRHSAR